MISSSTGYSQLHRADSKSREMNSLGSIFSVRLSRLTFSVFDFCHLNYSNSVLAKDSIIYQRSRIRSKYSIYSANY